MVWNVDVVRKEKESCLAEMVEATWDGWPCDVYLSFLLVGNGERRLGLWGRLYLECARGVCDWLSFSSFGFALVPVACWGSWVGVLITTGLQEWPNCAACKEWGEHVSLGCALYDSPEKEVFGILEASSPSGTFAFGAFFL